MRWPHQNFGGHSHGIARNSSSLLHLVIVRLTYFQTENGCCQKKLMAEPPMALAHGSGYLMAFWRVSKGRRGACPIPGQSANNTCIHLTTRAFICNGLVISGNGAFSGNGLIDLGVPVAVLAAAGLSFLGRAKASYPKSHIDTRPARVGLPQSAARQISIGHTIEQSPLITTIYLLAALRPRPTKSLSREAWVVGPDPLFHHLTNCLCDCSKIAHAREY